MNMARADNLHSLYPVPRQLYCRKGKGKCKVIPLPALCGSRGWVEV